MSDLLAQARWYILSGKGDISDVRTCKSEGLSASMFNHYADDLNSKFRALQRRMGRYARGTRDEGATAWFRDD